MLQEANRLTTDYYKRNPTGSSGVDNDRGGAAGARGRTKSPIAATGLNQTLSKFKSIDLNLIQALGNRKQSSGSGMTPVNRSASTNVLPSVNNTSLDDH